MADKQTSRFSNINNTVWKAKIDIQTNNNNGNNKVDFGGWQWKPGVDNGPNEVGGGVNSVNNIRSV